ncbi:MAG: type III secretion system effector XopQ [Alphaproteobacteria bacterium]
MLTKAETDLLTDLQSAHAGADPLNLVIITDIGRDHDDEVALLVTRGLEKLGLVKLCGVVANFSRDDGRARLAKGALQAIGAGAVPVAVGANDNPHEPVRDYELSASYLAAPEEVEPDGQILLKRLFSDAQKSGETLDLVLISGMTDARDFIRDNVELSRQVIGHVNIMGGVESENGQPRPDSHGHLRPDSAYNNCIDKHLNADPQADPVGPSAKDLYHLLQAQGIPTRIVTRFAAYATAVTPQFYDDLAAGGHPVASRIRQFQKSSLEHLWRDIQSGTMGPRLTPDWFCQTFCTQPHQALKALQDDPGASPWPHVGRLMLYDPVTVLAAVMPPRAGLLAPWVHKVAKDDGSGDGIEHQVIGISDDTAGLDHPAHWSSLMAALTKLACS